MITAASELSWERVVGRQGAAEASAGLSGRRGEEEEVDVERRSQEAALEVGVVLSEQEAQVDPWEVHRVLWVACPWVEEACQEAAVPLIETIPVEQEVEAP